MADTMAMAVKDLDARLAVACNKAPKMDLDGSRYDCFAPTLDWVARQYGVNAGDLYLAFCDTYAND